MSTVNTFFFISLTLFIYISLSLTLSLSTCVFYKFQYSKDPSLKMYLSWLIKKILVYCCLHCCLQVTSSLSWTSDFDNCIILIVFQRLMFLYNNTAFVTRLNCWPNSTENSSFSSSNTKTKRDCNVQNLYTKPL